jgi:hypothetical protein
LSLVSPPLSLRLARSGSFEMECLSKNSPSNDLTRETATYARPSGVDVPLDGVVTGAGLILGAGATAPSARRCDLEVVSLHDKGGSGLLNCHVSLLVHFDSNS